MKGIAHLAVIACLYVASPTHLLGKGSTDLLADYRTQFYRNDRFVAYQSVAIERSLDHLSLKNHTLRPFHLIISPPTLEDCNTPTNIAYSYVDNGRINIVVCELQLMAAARIFAAFQLKAFQGLERGQVEADFENRLVAVSEYYAKIFAQVSRSLALGRRVVPPPFCRAFEVAAVTDLRELNDNCVIKSAAHQRAIADLSSRYRSFRSSIEETMKKLAAAANLELEDDDDPAEIDMLYLETRGYRDILYYVVSHEIGHFLAPSNSANQLSYKKLSDFLGQRHIRARDLPNMAEEILADRFAIKATPISGRASVAATLIGYWRSLIGELQPGSALAIASRARQASLWYSASCLYSPSGMASEYARVKLNRQGGVIEPPVCEELMDADFFPGFESGTGISELLDELEEHAPNLAKLLTESMQAMAIESSPAAVPVPPEERESKGRKPMKLLPIEIRF